MSFVRVHWAATPHQRGVLAEVGGRREQTKTPGARARRRASHASRASCAEEPDEVIADVERVGGPVVTAALGANRRLCDFDPLGGARQRYAVGDEFHRG